MLMLIMLMGLLFIISIQPMFMMSVLILIVLMYSLMMYMMLGNYWFSYALMLVMLSGVLVIFTYMISLIPNESFEGYNLIYMMFFMMFMLGFYYMWMYDLKFGMNSLNLWVTFFGIFNLFMLCFLLMIMLMVVWYSYIGDGALRIS